MKTVKRGEGDIAAMTSALERTDVSPDDGFHLHFALGKALEDAGEAERSFRHYSDGNRLRRPMIDYDPPNISDPVRSCYEVLTAPFFAGLLGLGSPSPAPHILFGIPHPH